MKSFGKYLTEGAFITSHKEIMDLANKHVKVEMVGKRKNKFGDIEYIHKFEGKSGAIYMILEENKRKIDGKMFTSITNVEFATEDQYKRNKAFHRLENFDKSRFDNVMKQVIKQKV